VAPEWIQRRLSYEKMKTSPVLRRLTEWMPGLPISIVKIERRLYDITGGRVVTTIEAYPADGDYQG